MTQPSKALEEAAKALFVERAVRGGSRREDAQAVSNGVDFNFLHESLSDLIPDARAIIRAYAANVTEEMAEAAANVRTSTIDKFSPEIGVGAHLAAVKRCIRAAIEEGLK